MRMRVLLTGFAPFGGETVNPSWQAASAVQAPEGMELLRLELPTEFAAAPALALEALRREQPDAVLCLGQAGGRDRLTLERVAINCMAAAIPDNAGVWPTDQPVDPAGEAAYFTTLPIRRMADAMQAAGVPAGISNSAGTFVCNALLYRLLRAPETKDVPCGFLHLPYLPEQTEGKPDGTPSMPLETMLRGLRAALGALAGDS